MNLPSAFSVEMKTPGSYRKAKKKTSSSELVKTIFEGSSFKSSSSSSNAEEKEITLKILIRLKLTILFFCVSMIGCSAEELRYYIVDNSKLDNSDLPRRSYGEDLFAVVDGTDYLFAKDHLVDYSSKSIFAKKDLDGDGRDEVILDIHHGGNCCGYEYAICQCDGVITDPTYYSYFGCGFYI